MRHATHRTASKSTRFTERLLDAADGRLADVGRRREPRLPTGFAPLLWGGAAILVAKVGLALLVFAPLLGLRGA